MIGVVGVVVGVVVVVVVGMVTTEVPLQLGFQSSTNIIMFLSFYDLLLKLSTFHLPHMSMQLRQQTCGLATGLATHREGWQHVRRIGYSLGGPSRPL